MGGGRGQRPKGGWADLDLGLEAEPTEQELLDGLELEDDEDPLELELDSGPSERPVAPPARPAAAPPLELVRPPEPPRPSVASAPLASPPAVDRRAGRLNLPPAASPPADRPSVQSARLPDALPPGMFEEGQGAPKASPEGRSIPSWVGALALVVGVLGVAGFFLTRGPAPPPMGMISVGSAPEGAEVWMDGAPIGQRTPAQVFDLPVGKRVWVAVSKTGYLAEPPGREVVVGREGLSSAYFELKRVTTVALSTEPPGAQVAIDGALREGKTPLSLTDLEVGRAVELEVRLDGRMPTRVRLTPTEDPDPVALSLPPAVGLTITSEPSGATVRVGERILGETPLYETPVEKGQRMTLRVEKRGFRTKTRRLTPRREAQLHFDLAELPLTRLPLDPEGRREAGRLDRALGAARRRVEGLRGRVDALDARLSAMRDDPSVLFGTRARAQTRLDRAHRALLEAEDRLERLRLDAERLRARALDL